MKKGLDYIGVAAGAMIIDDNGRVLLAKRSQTVKNERGHWENPGGSIEFGETLEDAMRREMGEEFGVEVDIVKVFPAADHLIPAEKQHWVATTFLVKIRPGHTPRIMEPEKCDEIGWFELDSLPEPLSIITKLDLEKYRKPESTGLNEAKDKTVSQLTRDVKESFATYDSQGTRHWTWETAVRDLPYQVGSLSKVLLQISGDRYKEGKENDELQWQLRNELADIMAEVLYIAGELGIDMNQAMAEMVDDDIKKVTERSASK